MDQAFWSPFEVRQESAPSVRKSPSSSIQDPKYTKFFDEIERFYGVKKDFSFDVVFVWWPLLRRTHTDLSGPFFIMERNPASPDLNVIESDIVFHEIVHSISARQNPDQKQRLTREFLVGCNPLQKVKPLRILEEPLAVSIGQMLFLERFNPAEFKSTKRWYRNSWVNAFAPLIHPFVKSSFENKRSIDDAFIQQLIPDCRRLYESRANFP